MNWTKDQTNVFELIRFFLLFFLSIVGEFLRCFCVFVCGLTIDINLWICLDHLHHHHQQFDRCIAMEARINEVKQKKINVYKVQWQALPPPQQQQHENVITNDRNEECIVSRIQSENHCSQMIFVYSDVKWTKTNASTHCTNKLLNKWQTNYTSCSFLNRLKWATNLCHIFSRAIASYYWMRPTELKSVCVFVCMLMLLLLLFVFFALQPPPCTHYTQ